MGYYETYQEQRERELQAHRDYWTSYTSSYTLKSHPFQGPDKLGHTLKCGTAGGPSTTWTYRAPAEPKPWKPDNKPSAASTRNVEMGTRIYSHDGLTLHFWSLAPADPGVRRWKGGGRSAAETEFVWLILDSNSDDGARSVYHALIVKETGEVLWIDNGRCYGHWTPKDAKELSNSA